MSDIFSRFKSTIIQSFFYSIGNLTGKLSGLILLPLYSFFLPVETFGLYALFEVIFQVFQVFSGLGIKLGLSRWYWDKNEHVNKKSLFFTTYIFNILAVTLLSIILYLSFNFLSVYYFKTSINQYHILIFIIGNYIRLLSEVPMLLLRIQQRAKKYSLIQVIQLVTYLLFVVLFLAILGFDLDGLFWANIISATIQLLFVIPVIVNNVQFRIELKALKEMLTYGFPVALGNMVNITFNFTDKYFLNWFSDLKAVGTFTLAHKISNLVNLIVVNSFINAYMHNYFASLHDENSERFYCRSFTYFVLALTFFSLLIILFIDEAIFILSANNKEYSSSSAIVPILIIGLIFGGIRQMLNLPLNKVKKTRVIGVLSIAAGFLNVILNYLFIPKWSSIGAAYATGIVQFISSTVLLYFVIKYVKLAFEWKRIILILVGFIASLSVLSFIKTEFVLVNIVLKISIVILWGVYIYLSGFLYSEEKIRVKQLFNKWCKISEIMNNIKSLKN